MIRLDRGGPEFLIAVTAHLGEWGETESFSPALYGGTTRVWRRAGFEDHAKLSVMERSLASEAREIPTHDISTAKSPDWDALVAVDRSAFDGFWGMSVAALRDAVSANRRSIVLEAKDGPKTVGYAIAGTQWGTAYLHRIAVDPDHGGQGYGAALLARAVNWARSGGSKSMVLNVRPENQRARRVYEKASFADAGSSLTVLRHEVL